MIEASPLDQPGDWAAPWQPSPAPHHALARRGRALQPLLAAAAAELGAIFGRAAELRVGEAGRGLPCAAACLASLKLGGPLAAADHGGAVVAHYRARLAAALQPVVDRLWPAAELPAALALELVLAADDGTTLSLAITLPPATAERSPAPAAGPGLAADLPLRLRVELASETVAASSLLPLEPGLLLPVTALPEMAVRLGDHRVGRATVVPLPDGRQQATITAIDIQHQGELG